jgi:hypothetical protein
MELAEQANTDDIRADLEYMTARWGDIPGGAAFEVRAFKEGTQPHTARFSPDRIDEAVEWIRSMNDLGRNLYVVRNPIRPDVIGSASDTDIIAAFFLWADCDDLHSTENIRKFTGPKFSASIITGEVPEKRVHVYWQLTEPMTDMQEWTRIQQGIAAHFNSDKSVVNPSRIMRIAGTVAYPARHKQERGYVSELTTFRNVYDDAREPVSIDQMQRVFASAAPQAPTQGMFAIPTNDYGPALDRERAKVQALAGNEWHHAVVKLTGSYVAKGLSDSEIHALTDPLTLSGFTVEQTRAEVQAAIDGARRKGWTPEPQPAPVTFDFAPATNAPAQDTPAQSWAVQSVSQFTADFVAPEYLIDGVVQRGRLYTLTAPTGSGKTAVMLHVGLCIAQGQTVCERETEIGDVLYMAGENPDDVRARIIATMDAQDIDPNKCRMHFIPGTFSIRQDMEAIKAAIDALPNVVLVVVDTLAAYFDGDDANSNAQMLDFARVLRNITTAKGKPAVVVPAHPVKNAAKTNLTPMGGSALLNEVDGNLCLWKRETAVEMHWQGKHRGAEFDPLMFELKGVESSLVKDSKGRFMPTVLATPLLETRAMEIAASAYTLKERLLLNIEQYQGQSVAQRCIEIGLVNSSGNVKKSSLVKMLEGLQDEKLVKRILNNWLLTEKGEKAVEIIRSGGSPVDIEL